MQKAVSTMPSCPPIALDVRYGRDYSSPDEYQLMAVRQGSNSLTGRVTEANLRRDAANFCCLVAWLPGCECSITFNGTGAQTKNIASTRQPFFRACLKFKLSLCLISTFRSIHLVITTVAPVRCSKTPPRCHHLRVLCVRLAARDKATTSPAISSILAFQSTSRDIRSESFLGFTVCELCIDHHQDRFIQPRSGGLMSMQISLLNVLHGFQRRRSQCRCSTVPVLLLPLAIHRRLKHTCAPSTHPKSSFSPTLLSTKPRHPSVLLPGRWVSWMSHC